MCGGQAVLKAVTDPVSKGFLLEKYDPVPLVGSTWPEPLGSPACVSVNTAAFLLY